MVPPVLEMLDSTLLVQLHDDGGVHDLFEIEAVDAIDLLLNVLNFCGRVFRDPPGGRRGLGKELHGPPLGGILFPSCGVADWVLCAVGRRDVSTLTALQKSFLLTSKMASGAHDRLKMSMFGLAPKSYRVREDVKMYSFHFAAPHDVSPAEHQQSSPWQGKTGRLRCLAVPS